MDQIKELNKTSEKRTKQNGNKQSNRCRDQNILKELSEDLNSIKKIQSEVKDTLTEIKNNLQGNNHRVDEAKIQINDLEHKEANDNQSEQQEEKRIQKNEDSISSL